METVKHEKYTCVACSNLCENYESNEGYCNRADKKKNWILTIEIEGIPNNNQMFTPCNL